MTSVVQKLCGGIVVGATVLAGACGAREGASPTAPTPSTPPARASILIAEINGPFSFFPSPATLAPGTTFVWENDDRETHRIVVDTASIDTGNLAPDTISQPVTLPPGTWSYHCTIHPEMVGQVTMGR